MKDNRNVYKHTVPICFFFFPLQPNVLAGNFAQIAAAIIAKLIIENSLLAAHFVPMNCTLPYILYIKKNLKYRQAHTIQSFEIMVIFFEFNFGHKITFQNISNSINLSKMQSIYRQVLTRKMGKHGDNMNFLGHSVEINLNMCLNRNGNK